MADSPVKPSRQFSFELTMSNVTVVVIVAVLSFVLGYAMNGSGGAVSGPAGVTGGIGSTSLPAGSNAAQSPELRGQITDIDGNVVTLSSLTSLDPTLELPNKVEYVVGAEVIIAQHGHMSEAEISAAQAERDAANAAHIAAENAGQDVSNLPYIEEPVDIHNYTTLTFADLRVGQYAAISSADLNGLSRGRLTATTLVVDSVPIQ